MRSSKSNTKGNGRRKLTGLAVGAAVLFAASPVLAQGDSTPARARDSAARAAADPASPVAGLNIGYFDRANVPAEVMQSLQAEVERLLTELGITVASPGASDLSGNGGVPSGTLLNVVIWEQLPKAWDVPRNTMGVCPDSGKLPRNVYIFEPTILDELGLASKGIDDMRAEDVGRAFGRVVAHEVIHAFATFAGEHRHRGTGLMGEGLDKDTLLRPGLSVDERSGVAFREGLAKAVGAR